MKKILLLGATCLLMAQGVFAQISIWYVSENGNGNGTSWDSPFADIQDAINTASSGDQIWVATGYYSGNYDLDNKNLYIYGGFDGSEAYLDERLAWRENETIVDGGGNAPVFHMDGNSMSVIDGFTIINGYGEGAGVNGVGSNFQVSNCIFTGNEGRGIIMQESAYEDYLIPSLFHNLDFHDNKTVWGTSSEDGVITIYGGFLFTDISSVTMSDNESDDDIVAVSVFANPFSQSDQTNVNIYNSIFWNSGYLLHDRRNNQQLCFMTVYNSLIQGSGGSASWSYSNIYDGGGNIDADPLFSDGYHLADNSPAVGNGSISFLPSYDFSNYDLDNQPRYDAVTYAMDMGAYENQTAQVSAWRSQKNARKMKVGQNDEAIDIYPTVVRSGEMINANCKGDGKCIVSAVIYNLAGQQLSSASLQNGINSLQMPSPAGTYILIIRNNGEIVSQEKIIATP